MSDRWHREHQKDHWRRAAREEGYRSRAAWKLKQMQERFEFMRPGDTVLDVGCFPGGWSQVALQIVGDEGRVVGIDLEQCEPIDGCQLLMGDITELSTQERVREQVGKKGVNVVISDISPQLTGGWGMDQSRSLHLVCAVLDFSLPLLAKGGNFITKFFQGRGVELLEREMRKRFGRVRRHSPTASRNASSEVYLLAQRYLRTKVSENTEPFGELIERRLEEIESKGDSKLDGLEIQPSEKRGFQVRRRRE